MKYSNKVILLVVLGVVLTLAYLNVYKTNQITIINSELENTKLNNSSSIFSSYKISSNLFNELNINRKLSLIALFGDYGCFKCKINLAQNINDLAKSYKENIKVIYVGDNIISSKKLNLDLEFQKSSLIGSFFPMQLNNGQPVAFLLDDNRNILLMLNTEPEHIEKIKEYFQIIHTVFEVTSKNTKE